MKVIWKILFFSLLGFTLLLTVLQDVLAIEKTRGTVTFIFDDGRENIVENAYPVFKKHKVPASISIFTNGIGRKGYISKQELLNLNKNGWEVLSHGISHSSLRNMNDKIIATELKSSKDVLNKLGLKVNGFVAPYSYIPQGNITELKKHYSYAFNGYVDSRREPVNKLIANSKTPYNIVRANMEGKTLKELKQYIDYIHAEGKWLVLYEHEINTKGHISVKELDILLSYAKQKKVSIRNPAKVYGKK
jgi:peptidoglycan/xylan/chitin deacetylase (PgdA/CDA1 family)